MAALFRGMAGELTSLRTTAQQAEAEADLLDVIRNDPDLNEQAKKRRAGEARNPDTLKDFTRGEAAVSEQAANILDYLKNKLASVNPDAKQGRCQPVMVCYALLGGAVDSSPFRKLQVQHRWMHLSKHVIHRHR